MMKDFKKFILKGNVMDLAVAVIIGGAFGKIIASFVNDVLMPVIGMLLGNIDFTTLRYVITEAVGDQAEVAILYGQFIQSVVDFIIIALAIFMMIRMIEKSKKKQVEAAPAPAAPPADVVLLTEIRDLLKKD